MAEFKNKTPPTRLTVDDLPDLSPLSIQWLGEKITLDGLQVDGRLCIHLHRYKLSRNFVFEYKKDWTARPFTTAIAQAKRYAEITDDLPLVIVPYMSDQHLNALYEGEISGMDLCGNAFLFDGKGWMFRFSGKPNRFRNTKSLRSPYQGKSGLVARTLVDCPVLNSAEELRAEIKKRGGDVSQPMISRALKAFREDLVIGTKGQYSIVLLQPEKLLDRLTEQWRLTTERWQQGPTVLWRGKVEGDIDEARKAIFAQAKTLQRPIVRNWSDFTTLDSPVTTSGLISLYAATANGLLDTVVAEETRRFPNLEILSAPDESVFFNVLCSNGDCLSSRLQLYLELAVGDARAQSAAEMIRKEILEDVERTLDDVGIWL